MHDRKKIIAIPGSIRQGSTNRNLINAIIQLFSDKLNIKIFEGLADIPHFNPDFDNENPPAKVSDFRSQLKNADGILICTPEYAMGVPGSLKNAVDWTVSSMEFSKKPTALITASSLGEKAHESLTGTLKIIEANLTEKTQLLISGAKPKISGDNRITDKNTLEKVMAVM